MSSVQDIKHFVGFAAKQIGLTSIPKINFVGHTEDKKDAFGHFISDRKGSSITIRITDRHPIDVMRTIAHELIHWKQRISGMRSSEGIKEDEANAIAGRIMRAYDTKFPGKFKDRPIKEDTGAVTTGLVGAGTGDNPDPTKPLAQPLFGKRKKLKEILKRRSPVEEAHIFHKKKLFADASLRNSSMNDRYGKLKDKADFTHSSVKGEDDEEKADHVMRKAGGNSKKTILPIGD